MNRVCPIEFRATGIAIVDPFLDDGRIDELIRLVEPLLDGPRRRPGVRGVLKREPRIADVLRRTQVPALIESLGGAGCQVVRALLFDKSPEANWLVPWHQDATIALAERFETPGFGPWAFKDGEHHCQPPLDVLRSIFTVRIHLDACTPESGPLRVVVGSHLAGLIDEPEIADRVRDGVIVEAVTGRGGAVATTPLSIHSSPRSANPAARRRVLHFDCTSAALPGHLRWAEAVGLTALAAPPAVLPSSRTSAAR